MAVSYNQHSCVCNLSRKRPAQLPGGFLHSWDLTLQRLQSELELWIAKYTSGIDQGEQKQTYSTETKLAHDSPSTTRLRTPVFDGSGAGVPAEGVELELSLVADLRREGLVTSYVEVCSTGNFVGSDAFASFYVAENPNFCHRLLSLAGEDVCIVEGRRKKARRN